MALKSIITILVEGSLALPGETTEFLPCSALTRHHLFCTLLANNAPGAFSRFLQMGIKPFLKDKAELWPPA